MEQQSPVAPPQVIPSSSRTSLPHPHPYVHHFKSKTDPEEIELEKRKKEQEGYAQLALDYYHENNPGQKYELFRLFGRHVLMMAGVWTHVCFVAKPIPPFADGHDKILTYFFAEIACPIGKSPTIICRIVDPDNSETTMDGCRECPRGRSMYHPTDGFEAGNDRRNFIWPRLNPKAGRLGQLRASDLSDVSIRCTKRSLGSEFHFSETKKEGKCVCLYYTIYSYALSYELKLACGFILPTLLICLLTILLLL